MASSHHSSRISSFQDQATPESYEKHRYRPVGAALYKKFDRQVQDLDEQLLKLRREARLLGNGTGILSASTQLRERLSQVLLFFCQNAKHLYPEEIQAYIHAQRSSHRPRVGLHRFSPTKFSETEDIAAAFLMFSREVKTLFYCFYQVPEFVQELPDPSIPDELEIWAKSLDNFECELGSLAVQTYLYDSMVDIGDRLETLAKEFIPTFKKIGIPAIQASREHAISNVQNQTIVSTLFASVATGMIQVYSNDEPVALTRIIVLLWYMTVLLSIGSTVNGVLGLSWAHAIYQTHNRLVRWWMLIWINNVPLVFLVLALGCSFVALTLNSFLPGQSVSPSIIITSFAAFFCLGLFLIPILLSCEWLIFGKNERLIRLVLANFKSLYPIFITKWLRGMKRASATRDPEQAINIGFRPTSERASTSVDFWLAHDRDAMNIAERARHRWHEAVRRIIQEQRERTSPCSKFAHLSTSLSKRGLVRKLLTMAVTGDYHINEAHGALVRSMQFSPDGKHLVTSSWDSRSFLFRIGIPVLCERVLKHPPGTGYVHQVNWSPDGKKLLMRSTQSLNVWELRTETDDIFLEYAGIFTHKPDENDRVIYGASWNGDGSRFYSLQGRRVLTMDISGQIWLDYPMQHLDLRAVTVTSNSKWMICVGKYKKDYQHIDKRYGMIVWNIQRRVIVKYVPVFYEINDVAVASDDKSVLVSYVNKSPSQLWQLSTNDSSVDFTLQHSYLPKDSTPFAAIPSIFGGEHDHLVLRVTTVGDIFVWERHSTIILHCIRAPPTLRGCITSFAWNRGSEEYMFATGTRDGTIHIWTEDKLAQAAEPEDHDDHTQQAPVFTEELTSEPERLSQASMEVRYKVSSNVEE